MKHASTSAQKTQSSRDVVDFPSPSSRAHKHAAPDQDLEIECDVNIPALIPSGIYDAIFYKAEKKIMWGGEKIFLWFQIVTPGDYHGATLWMACNGPAKGKVGLSSKYFAAWCLAAGRRPDRFDRLGTKIFKDKVFELKVRAVTKDTKGRPLTPALQYSIIDDLLSC